MARTPNLEKLSYVELRELRDEIDSLLVQRQAEEKQALKAKLSQLAEAQGFSLSDIVGEGRRKNGPVPIKYRDPKNSANTWTGRGRMPRWMTAALKTRGTKKEDFLV